MTSALALAPRLSPDLLERLVATASVGSHAEHLSILAPFDGQPLYELPIADEGDVDAAVESLRIGQAAWAARSVAERARIMLRFHDLVLARRAEGLDIVQWETGKARRDAMEELLDVCLNARHYARDAGRLLRPRRHLGGLPFMVGATEVHHPKGVVGVLAPWNYPLTLTAGDAIPALMAGNAVLIKPDVQTTLTALWVVGLMVEAGVPDTVVHVVPGDGALIGPMVIDRVDYVMFTGSTRVGREVAARCGERLIGCSLELGGKNAMIVRADVNVRRSAAIAARACFSNSGQLCISMERIYIHQDVYETFVTALVDAVTAMTLRSVIGWGADMGSLVSARQLDRVQAHVDDAVNRGATVLVGGHARPDIGPYFFEPTLLSGVTDQMSLCSEETFGPVAAVYPVASDEEAVRRANDSDFGLNASVLTGDPAAGRALAYRIKAGTVNINEGYGPAWSSTRSPMGGRGDSGLGRRHGDEGFMKYTESQTIATQRILSFGGPLGLSDKMWFGTLASALGAMKRIGLK